jgi:hypothetical protein
MVGMLYIESQRLIRIEINYQAVFISGIITALIWYMLSKVVLHDPWLSLTVKTLLLTPVLVLLVAWLNKSRKMSRLASGMHG